MHKISINTAFSWSEVTYNPYLNSYEDNISIYRSAYRGVDLAEVARLKVTPYYDGSDFSLHYNIHLEKLSPHIVDTLKSIDIINATDLHVIENANKTISGIEFNGGTFVGAPSDLLSSLLWSRESIPGPWDGWSNGRDNISITNYGVDYEGSYDEISYDAFPYSFNKLMIFQY